MVVSSAVGSGLSPLGLLFNALYNIKNLYFEGRSVVILVKVCKRSHGSQLGKSRISLLNLVSTGKLFFLVLI